MSWPQIKKNNKNKTKLSFWNVIFSYSTQQQWIISSSDCEVWWKVDFIQLVQWLDRGEAPKHFPKPNLHQEKVMVTVWWSAASLIHYSFLNPSETITSKKYAQQIDELNRKLQLLQPALVNWRAQCFSAIMPNSMSHDQCFKSWMN